MEKDSINNDELVAMIKGGFDQVGKDIAEVNNKVDTLRTELKSEISAVRTELKSEVHTLRTELKSEISAVRTELKSEMHTLRTELKSEISDLRTEVRDGFMKTNDKVDLLAVKLSDKNVITKKDAKEVMAINPVSIS